VDRRSGAARHAVNVAATAPVGNCLRHRQNLVMPAAAVNSRYRRGYGVCLNVAWKLSPFGLIQCPTMSTTPGRNANWLPSAF